MVRRVGFGDSDRPPKENRNNKSPAPAPRKAGGKRTTRWIVGAFLLFWLAAWSTAIAASINEIMDQGLGAADIGLFIWVAVASVFWLLAVNLFWRVLTGRPLSSGKKRRSSSSHQQGHGLDRGDWDHGGDD